ncbi:MAG: transcription elongation factor GreA [Nocardioidaceae bacterium]|nr:transcription elongation factor GreA [Nocardioidaceae bacterium]
MSEQTQETIWVTQEAYDRLTSELDNLRGPVRTEITQKIADARDEGDLKENGGYHAAREEQGKTEARIRQLESLLNRAVVGEQRADDGIVQAGMIVSITFKGDKTVETFMLGSRELLTLDDSVDLSVYSPESPLGASLMGKSKGDTATYEAPNGKEITVTIVDAKPFTG